MPGLNSAESSALARWVERLRELGVEARAETSGHARSGVGRGVLHLTRGTAHRDYSLRYGQSIPMSSVGGSDEERPPFVFTTYVAPKSADAFRRAGIQYLDSAGNASIEFGDVFIDVRGRPRPKAGTVPSRAAGNLFSAGRAQVVFALLAWRQLWDAPQRDIAEAAGASVGQVNGTLRLLKQSGYTRKGARAGQADLLDLWAASFQTGLAHRLTLAQFSSDRPIRSESVGSAHVSGAAAVPDLLRSPTAVLYVVELDPKLPIANRWRSDGEPTITIRRKFWTEPAPPSARRGKVIAPWPLIYADLLASEDPRERAAAAEVRQRHARPQ